MVPALMLFQRDDQLVSNHVSVESVKTPAESLFSFTYDFRYVTIANPALPTPNLSQPRLRSSQYGRKVPQVDCKST